MGEDKFRSLTFLGVVLALRSPVFSGPWFPLKSHENACAPLSGFRTTFPIASSRSLALCRQPTWRKVWGAAQWSEGQGQGREDTLGGVQEVFYLFVHQDAVGVVELTLITMTPRGLWDVSTPQRNRNGRILEPCVWHPLSTLSGRVWTLYSFDIIVFPLSCLGPALQSTGVQDRVLAEAQGHGPLGSPGASWWILRSTPGKPFLTIFLKIRWQAGTTVCLGPGFL